MKEIRSRIENDSRKTMNKISTIERFEEWSRQYPESFEQIEFNNQMTFDTSEKSVKEIAKTIVDEIN